MTRWSGSGGGGAIHLGEVRQRRTRVRRGHTLLLPRLCVLRAGASPATGTHRFDHLPEVLRKLGHRGLELVTGNSLT